MKKLFATIAFTAATLLSSCASDDTVQKYEKVSYIIDGTKVTLTDLAVSVDAAPTYFDPDGEYKQIFMGSYPEFRIFYAIKSGATLGDTFMRCIQGKRELYTRKYSLDFEIKTSHHVKGTFSGTFGATFTPEYPDDAHTITDGTFDIIY